MNTADKIRAEAERRYGSFLSYMEVFIEHATFGASLNGWVSVKDIPNKDGDYFVYLSNGQGWVAGWHNNKWYRVDNLDVTHYMKIVKP